MSIFLCKLGINSDELHMMHHPIEALTFFFLLANSLNQINLFHNKMVSFFIFLGGFVPFLSLTESNQYFVRCHLNVEVMCNLFSFFYFSSGERCRRGYHGYD